MSAPNTLDLLRFPLHGSRLIEASAGTGKTFTIALLYARLVLGHGGEADFSRPLMPPDILVVTFTEAATQELRDRIRARLAEAARCFAEPDAPVDELLRTLRDEFPREAWPGCARRLQLAAEWMDEAAVSTIHGWCSRMLREHAFDSGSLFHQTLVTDQSELLHDTVRDYWREHFYTLADAHQAAAVLRLARDPGALLQQLTPLLGKPDSQCLFLGQPLEAVPDIRPLLEEEGAFQAASSDWQATRDTLENDARQAWHDGWAEIEPQLLAIREQLNGTYHDSTTPGKFAALLAALHVWSQGGEAPGKLKNFATGAFRFKGKQPPAEPSHPACQRLAALVAHDEQKPVDNDAPRRAAALLQHAAHWVNERLEQQLRRRAELGFDALLRRMDQALQGPGGERFAATLRQQFPVAMIDEFQDTDPLQYRLFDRVYRIGENAPDTALVMIGDPKQAIYAFRGADIHTYLRARDATTGRHYTLDTNFRSSSAMVAAVNHLFQQGESHPRGAFRFRTGEEHPLPFHPVRAQGRGEHFELEGTSPPALTGWYWQAEEGVASTEAYRAHFAEVAASEIVRWLTLAREGRAGFRRDDVLTPLRPADIALLVRDRKEASLLREALRRRGLASVYLSDRDSVFASDEARDLLFWLRACAQPEQESGVRAALATGSLALPLAELARLNDDELLWEAHALRFRDYRQCWRRLGVLPMLRRLLGDYHLPTRLLARQDGERSLTNILHLAEWLQQASTHLDGEQALIRHLAEQVDTPTDEQILRLESDAELIKVITIHKSKGLEYPLVLLPFACTWRNTRPDERVVGYQGGQSHCLELAGAKAAPEAQQRADDERLSEDMRLLYVALTRARHGVWLGLAPLRKGNVKQPQLEQTAMGYLLGGGEHLPAESIHPRLSALLSGPGLALCDAPAPGEASVPPVPQVAPGEARQPTRRVAEHWWIASYSALQTGAHAEAEQGTPPVLPEPENARQSTAAEEPTPAPEDAIPAPEGEGLHAFPRGPGPGTFLHGLLEWAGREGFARAAANAPLCAEVLERRCRLRGWQAHTPALQSWLARLLEEPLPLGDTPLRLAALTQYQVELEFWLESRRVDTQSLDALVTAGTLQGVARPRLLDDTLNGMLKGFMDLVFEWQGRYYVADWKSNWLGPDASAYTAEAMQRAVLESRYELQYTLYLLALHRLLKNRLPDYDYDHHIGGAMYVFLRGMDNPTRGVHTERPPRALIEQLDALFAGRRAQA